jgi:hypothetical protein
MTVIYSLDTQHYFHIRDKGRKFKDILHKFKGLFAELEKFAMSTKIKFQHNNKSIDGYGIIGEIDLLDSKNTIWEIKCVQEITLKHILQVLMYNIIHHNLGSVLSPEVEVKLNFLSFIRGEHIEYVCNLTMEDIKNIIDTFKKVGKIV